MYSLPDYLWAPQRRGIEETIGLLEAGKDVCLYAPTGGGKTQQAIELLNWTLDRGGRGAFYLNRKILIAQTAARFGTAGLPYGIRAADYEDLYDFSAPIQICSANTEMARVFRRKIWQPFECDLVIVDESHIQKATTMKEILADHKTRNAQVVLLTATPIGISHMADELVVSGTMQEYRDCNALVPAVVRSIEQPDLSKVKRTATGEYVLDGEKRRIYTQAIVGHVLDRWKKYNPDAQPTMLYAPGKPESVWFTEKFEEMGVPWCHVDATEAVLDKKRYKLTRSLWTDILARQLDGSIKGISSRFKCLDAKTEILTERGWAGMDDFQDDDVVAAVDSGTGLISWEVPSRVVRQKHNGDFYRIKSQSLDVRVTDDHELLVRCQDRRCKTWKTEEARVAAKRRGTFEIPVSAHCHRRAGRQFEGEGVALTDHQLALIGWFLTDGHLRDTGMLVISQSLVQPDEIHQHILDTLMGCNVTWSSGRYPATLNGKRYSDFIQYRVNRQALERIGIFQFLDKDFEATLFRDCLQKMTRRQLEVMLKAINYADGCKRKTATWNVQTLEICKGNQTFLSRLQALCVTRGMRANLHPQDSCSRLYITPGRDYASVRGATPNDPPGMRRARLEREASKGEENVWCITTESGAIITRRNGKVAVVGNCREGLDVPSAFHCILATPIGSLASYIQTIGRVLRWSEATPSQVLITDHGGNYLRHGSPNHDRPWKDWWNLPEGVVSQMHTNQIKERKAIEPIRCPNCEGERTRGFRCPHCGHEHAKSTREVIMEDGRMVKHEGNLVKIRHRALKENTQDLWKGLIFGHRKKRARGRGKDLSFAQMEAWFFHEHHYWPPRDLKFMPKQASTWHQKIALVSMDDLF